MTRRRVLVCTNHLRNYAGSEIVTLELLEHFLDQDWNVDVYTNDLGDPVLRDISELPNWGRLRVVEASPEERFDDEYDLVWVQHALLPPTVIERLRDRGMHTRMVWNHLSSFMNIELPVMAETENRLASLSVGVSPRILQVLTEFGIPSSRLALFDNPVPDRFCDYPSTSSTTLDRVLVVSNHAPVVVREAADLLRQRGVTVDFLGAHDIARRVTPELLADYSAIVTIGKTVQYALTMGIPPFVLDHFGGSGWLDDANWREEHHETFSGRAGNRAWNSEVVAETMQVGYADARRWAEESRGEFVERWRLSGRLEKLLKDSRMKPRELRLTSVEARRHRAFVELYGDFYRLMISMRRGTQVP